MENVMDNNVTKEKSLRKIIYVVTTALFFLILAALLLLSILTPDKSFSERENRNLQTLPEISLSSVLNGNFMSRFENYVSDQLVCRELFVEAKTVYDRLFGKTEINGVYVGKENRLYETPSRYDEQKLKETLACICDFASTCNIENKHIMLVPNATEILPESLPRYLKCKSQEEQITQIYSALSKELIGINLCGKFKTHEAKEDFYFKTDHHWSAIGAFEGFCAYMDEIGFEYKKDDFECIKLSDGFYGTLSSSSSIYATPDVLEAIIPKNSSSTYYVQNAQTKEKTASVFDLSKLENENKYEVFFGGNFSKLVITTTAETDNTLLIFKDSYANSFIPMLTPYFHKIVVIDARYYTQDVKNELEVTDFTHLLCLYNLNTFLEDTSLKMIMQ